MSQKRKVFAVLIVVLAIVLVGSATWVFAQSSGEVAACVDVKGKVSALGFEENVSCDPDKQTKITWSITGPQGEKGNQGIQGEQGPPGVLDFYRNGSSQPIPRVGQFTVVVLCDEGDYPLNGFISGLIGGVDVRVSQQNTAFPTNVPNGWQFTLWNNLERNIGSVWSSLAICADMTP